MKFELKLHIFTPLLLLLCVIFANIAGCSRPSEPSPAPDSLPDSSAPLDERYRENPELIEADIYAEHFGVTADEALQRFNISDAFSGLDTELEMKEPETFGGLWIQHEPSFRIVIAFTRDGEVTIEKYVSGNLTRYIEVRKVKYSYAELLNAQSQLASALRDMGIPFDSAGYVQVNRVEFSVTDRTLIDKAILEGTLTIPDCVDIIVVEGLAVLE